MIKQVLFNGKVEVAISEINDGNMRFFGNGDEAEIIKNQKNVGNILELTSEKIARIKTIYDDRKVFTDYHEITNKNLPKYTILNPEEQIPISDGLVTKCPDVGILLPLADCLGIVVFDEEHSAVGLLHSGRQNIEQYGPKKFIEYLAKIFNSNPKKLKIYFSPYALNYRIYKLDNMLLSEAAKTQLAKAGILLENIIDYKANTVDSINLPSYSSGDKTQRFAIVVKQTQ